MEHTVNHGRHPRIQTHLRLRRQAIPHLGGQPVPRVLRAGSDPTGHRHRIFRQQGRPRGNAPATAARREGNLKARARARTDQDRRNKNRVIFAVRNLFVKKNTICEKERTKIASKIIFIGTT